MPSPDPSAAPTATADAPGWTEEEAEALRTAVFWFDLTASPELKDQYRGMHVAILGEQIVDADRDQYTLWDRLGANAVPRNRVLIRYVPTADESWARLWLR